MSELEKQLFDKISEVVDNASWYEYEVIKEFISKCGVSEFEKLKDLEYDISVSK